MSQSFSFYGQNLISAKLKARYKGYSFFHNFREGHKDVAEILLNHNADVELPDNYGQSPLFMACWKGRNTMLSF